MLKKNFKKNYFQKSFLNASDLQVESFISSFYLQKGFFPSQREIARQLKRSLSTIQFSLKKLKAQEHLAEKPMACSLVLPLLGLVAAGMPIEAITQSERIEVPSWMVQTQGSYFVLKVQGQSMIEDHIQDGDFVLIRQSEVANNGDRVVALIDHEVTLKRFEKKGDLIFLHPAHPQMSSIQVSSQQEFRIIGILSGVLRNIKGYGSTSSA